MALAVGRFDSLLSGAGDAADWKSVWTPNGDSPKTTATDGDGR